MDQPTSHYITKKKQLWFLTFDRNCPLGFAERLVYSHLVSKIRYGKSQTAKGIAANTGLHRGTVVPSSLAVLEEHGLAEKLNGRWQALQPSEETKCWLIARKNANEDWFERLAYFPISLPNRGKLTTRCAVVYWFLVSVANNRYQNITGIANSLSISWATASRAAKQLQELGLINAALRPTKAQCDDLWREGKKRTKKKTKPAIIDNYCMSSLFAPTFSLDAFNERSFFDEHVDRIGTKLRRGGYSEEDIMQYIQETYDSFGPKLKNGKMSWFLRESIEPLFAKAERDTRKNRAMRRYHGNTSLGLLCHLTKAFVVNVNKINERFDHVQIHLFCDPV